MVVELFNQITSNFWLLNSVIAIAIFISGLVLGKIISKIVRKVIYNIQINNIINKNAKKKIYLDKIISEIVKYLIYFFSAIMALSQLGIATTILNILSGALLIFILIVVFLSLKDFIPNITAGFFIYVKNYLQEGDKIKMQDIEGIITTFGFVETQIKTKQGDIIFIPNIKLTQYEVIRKKRK